MEKIDLKKLDKTDWQPYRFDEIAKSVSERVDPNNTDLEIYVGLEHLDSEDIHIRRKGTADDVNGQKLKCYPGDVIFGKRRAYQRKAAVVDFEGFCSAHALVLRANEEVIDPKLFPFFLHSDTFMHRAVDISVGSLSPTINWGTLKSEEFLLPPKEQQAGLAELLWAMDEVVEKENVILKAEIELKHSFRKKVFLGSDKDILKKNLLENSELNWELKKVADVCKICNTLRKPLNKEVRESMTGIYPYYGPTSVLSYISEFRLDGEFVLIGEDGDHFLKYNDWSMTQYVRGKFNVNNHAHILLGSEKCLTKWIYYSLQHRNIIPHLSKQGATRYKLNKESLQDILLLLPDIKSQEKLIYQFDLIEDGILKINSKIATSRSLQRSLINQIF